MTEQLHVNLAPDIIYVSGTVNGEVATFSLTSPGVWSAIVPASSDGRYQIEITAYNSLGTPTVYSTVVYKLTGLIPLKADWTRDDCYNPQNLNEVEANTQYIADYLTAVGYTVTLQPIETGRDYKRIEFADELIRIELNIHALSEGFITPPGYVEPKTWAALMPFDYLDANRLARNLLLLHAWAVGVVASFKYCGAFACGEGGEI